MGIAYEYTFLFASCIGAYKFCAFLCVSVCVRGGGLCVCVCLT